MKKYNLKHCPLCGNEVDLKERGTGGWGSFFSIECITCGVRLTGKNGADAKIIIDHWNTRAQTLDDCINAQKLINEQGEISSVHKLKNERGAGRKPKLSKKTIDEIIYMRSMHWSYRGIAETMKVSVGTVHKIISEHKKAV